MSDPVKEFRIHLAHANRELYEHNIDEPCPCGTCMRSRATGERRFVTIIILGLLLMWRLAEALQ